MSDAWYACDEPERPTDASVRWHYAECRGCAIKAEALVRQHPTDSHVIWLHSYINCGTEGFIPPHRADGGA